MSIVNVHQAKTQLSRLLAQVEDGQEVGHCSQWQAGCAPCRLSTSGANREFGILAGQITIDDSFFEPLPETELSAWEA